jgi:cell division protein FtsN
MNPKKILEGFRVDPSESKMLPKTKRNMYKKGNAFVVILFASLLGLMTGISSAFAFGIKELPPTSTPLDEPKAEYHTEQKEKTVQPIEKQISELAPLHPPLDEPTTKQKKEVDQSEQVIQAKSQELVEHKEQPKEKEQSKANTQQEPAKQPKVTEHSSQSQHHQSKQNEHKTTSNDAGVVLSQSKPDAATPPIASVKLEKPSKKTSIIKDDSPTPEPDIQPEQEKVSASETETPKPKTKSGILPETAGDDLNHALASFVVVCFSIAYLLAKKETRPE